MYMVVAYRAGRNACMMKRRERGAIARLVVQTLAGRRAGIVYY